jgi:UDP-glucose:(heptosyl)LPS alpha-1,3-glucosyltransferase
MRIAIVIPKLDPLRGGAESWSYALGTWLLARQHDVHFVATRFANCGELDPAALHICSRQRDPLAAAAETTRWFQGQSFDIVHDMGLGYEFDVLQPHFGSLVAHDLGKAESLSPVQRLMQRLLAPLRGRSQARAMLAARQLEHRQALVVAVSPMVGRDLQRFHNVPADRIRVVLNGVDAERFEPLRRQGLRNASRHKLGISESELAVLVVAHNHRLKGVPTLLAALKQAAAFPGRLHLVVAGGHRQAPCQKSIGRHRVTYTGACQDILPLYAAADVYAHPTHYDACCLSFLEAMACGLPAITTTINGASCVVEHGRNGLLMHRPKDVRELLGLLESLADPCRRASIGSAGRATAQSWTVADNFRAIEAVYEEIVARRRSATQRAA